MFESLLPALFSFFITYMLCLFFSGSTRFSLILAIFFAVTNYIQKLKLNPNAKIYSHFFPGRLKRVEYYNLVTFYLLGAIAKVKGRVTESDIAYAEELMQEFQADDRLRQKLILAYQQGKQAAFNLDKVLAEFVAHFKGHGQAINYFFDYQLQAAVQDRQLQNEELAILRRIAHAIGMNSIFFDLKIRSAQAQYGFQGQGTDFFSQFFRYYQQQKSGEQESDQYQEATSPNRLQSAYAILGVKETDNEATVKTAYRRLIKEYHPDRYTSKNVPSAILEQAKQKSQEIISAYHLISKAKGWK